MSIGPPGDQTEKTTAMALGSQEEFPFGEGENRGHFGTTERNLLTVRISIYRRFFRKGIRITPDTTDNLFAHAGTRVDRNPI